MAVDQLAFAPVFISLIVSSIMALEGHAGDVPAKLRADLPTMVRSNWTLWVPFQFVNFRYVPPQLQARMEWDGMLGLPAAAVGNSYAAAWASVRELAARGR